MRRERKMKYYLIRIEHLDALSPWYVRKISPPLFFGGPWTLTQMRDEAHRFSTAKMASYRARTLRVVKQLLEEHFSWKIVEVIPDKVVASSNDSALHQLARAVE